jgi:hypothetical protein
MTAAPFLHQGADVQARFTCIGHGGKHHGQKTLDGVRTKKTMRRRKALMKELGFFYPGQVCFICRHVLMGLWSGKTQSIFLGFYSANSTEELTYQGKRCMQKKREKSRE